MPPASTQSKAKIYHLENEKQFWEISVDGTETKIRSEKRSKFLKFHTPTLRQTAGTLTDESRETALMLEDHVVTRTVKKCKCNHLIFESTDKTFR